ncbi:MAG: RsmG family class I SAM-dependent methyltransferase, partial [Thermodesulfobacteriota bacterium]|nr:RsmG family class I SAM-dependent methyltransferase [Thermodesulfobacteriota bacterium]
MSKTSITPKDVARAAGKLGRDLSPTQAEGLAAYLEALVKWNAAVNLVGPSAWKEILGTLVADSWHLADFLRGLDLDFGPQGPLTLDIGAGAGLPGIPLRLFWDSGSYSMVEANKKRAAFLQFALSRISLPRTFVLPVRVEHLGEEFVPADIILSRAFCPWPDFLTLCRDKIKERGLCL